MFWADLETVVGEMMTPREWSDDELKGLAQTANTNGEDYDTVISEINNNDQILNKERAIQLVNEAYGKTPKVEKTQEEKLEEASQTGYIAAETIKGLGPAADKIIRWIASKYKMNYEQAKEFYKGMFKK